MATYEATMKTMVYENATGSITIMQEDCEQAYVVISTHQAEWLIRELQKILVEGE